MNFRLVWPIPMLGRLEEAYLRARAAGLATGFTAAIHRIEQALATDPLACGESRGGTIRLVIDSPIPLWYEPNHALKAVTIHDVRYYPPRPR
jgi:hypothetical protein